jgi:NADH dehydrogenase (ubiquinone) flavoprotein 2
MAHASSAHTSTAQPDSFAFTAENLEKAKAIIAKYPAGRQASAVLPLLDMAQRQNQNWLPVAAMNAVADLLGMPRVRVYEVATFFTMFNKQPVGKYLIQICTTTPCWLRGSDAIVETCKSKLGAAPGQSTADGLFSVMEVECLGACVNAPMVQINDDFYEDLTGESFAKVLDGLAAGKDMKYGPQVDRQASAPEGGPTTLKGEE